LLEHTLLKHNREKQCDTLEKTKKKRTRRGVEGTRETCSSEEKAASLIAELSAVGRAGGGALADKKASELVEIEATRARSSACWRMRYCLSKRNARDR
jgi:hypothetical protein